MKHKVRAIVAILLTLALVVPMLSILPVKAESANGPDGYELGTSTKYSGSKKIWVTKGYNDVDKSHWFYDGLQEWRKLGIVAGDENGNARLNDIIKAAEVYTFFVRYVYSDTYEGENINGALLGDYTYKGHAAWLDAYTEVNNKLTATIEAVGADVQLPDGQATVMTRKQAFVLYAMAALNRTADPNYYFNQFSNTHLGYYARSNKPIKTFDTNEECLGYFLMADHYSMSPLEIQSANLLMYLGVLNGKPVEGQVNNSMRANDIVTRGEGIKLLACLDQVERTPYVRHTSSGTPSPSPSTEPSPAPSTEPSPAPSVEPTVEPSPSPEPSPSVEPSPSPSPSDDPGTGDWGGDEGEDPEPEPIPTIPILKETVYAPQELGDTDVVGTTHITDGTSSLHFDGQQIGVNANKTVVVTADPGDKVYLLADADGVQRSYNVFVKSIHLVSGMNSVQLFANETESLGAVRCEFVMPEYDADVVVEYSLKAIPEPEPEPTAKLTMYITGPEYAVDIVNSSTAAEVTAGESKVVANGQSMDVTAGSVVTVTVNQVEDDVTFTNAAGQLDSYNVTLQHVYMTSASGTRNLWDYNRRGRAIVSKQVSFIMPEVDTTVEISYLTHESLSVLLVDWDNTLMGAIAAETNTDLRKAVNDYCIEHLVHPDLLKADANSLSREDNYRGEFDAYGTTDGDNYPLTNKLDYCFVQKPLTKVLTADGSIKYTQGEATGYYPYAYGWAACNTDFEDKFSSTSKVYESYINTWTTLGVGEMRSWNGTEFTWQPTVEGAGIRLPVEIRDLTPAETFEVADLASGYSNVARTASYDATSGTNTFVQNSIVLKAIYQPGPDLTDGNYSILDEENGYRLFKEGARAGAAAIYGFDYKFNRAEYDEDGNIHGVKRIRQPQLEKLCWMPGDYIAPVTKTAIANGQLYSIGTVPYVDIWMLHSAWINEDSPDVLEYEHQQTGMMAIDVRLLDLWDVDTSGNISTRRSDWARSDMAFTRQTWMETEETGPIYWCGGWYGDNYFKLAYAAVEEYDDCMARMCRYAAVSSLARRGLIAVGIRNIYDGATSYYGNVIYPSGEYSFKDYVPEVAASAMSFLSVSEYVGLPKFPDAAWWNTNSFSNNYMDPFSQCLFSITDYIIDNHPDQTDDTWWCTTKNWPSAWVEGTYEFRIPRLSYHQVILYWNDFIDWYMAGGVGDKPVPIPAAEADAMAISYCKLAAHTGKCHNTPEIDTNIQYESDAAMFGIEEQN